MRLGILSLTVAALVASVNAQSQCEENLGDIFVTTFPKDNWPTISNIMVKGRDDGVNFFVGGNYVCKAGAEIEGASVTLGNFHVKGAGLSNIGTVGVGSQIVPYDNQDSFIVGGDLILDRAVDYMFAAQGNARIGGVIRGSGTLRMTGGILEEGATIDLAYYNGIFSELKEKSDYWASLPANGVVEDDIYGLLFKAGDTADIQVFSLPTNRVNFPWGSWITFDSSLENKVMIINVHANNAGVVNMKNMAQFHDPFGGEGKSFKASMTANILWNLHDATVVNFGGATSGLGEFVGNVLIPTPGARAEMTFPGMSGRFIINGDLTQNKAGSEFHNYPFDPDYPLPLPPSCEGTPSPTPEPTPNPTPSPTPNPTPSPTPNPTPSPTPNPTPSPTPNQPGPTPGVSGDPHFKTWSGERYDFHGICDLVLLSNPKFRDDLGMDIHVRTKQTEQWSYVSSAVIRIGSETFEVSGSKHGNSFWMNGIKGDQWEEGTVISGYSITYKKTHSNQNEYVIDLGNKERIIFKTWKDFVRVDISGAEADDFGESLGLMGSYPDGKRIGRDAVTVTNDWYAFGMEWQVRSDQTLFHTIEGPQHPAKCEVPTKSTLRRRL